MAVTLEELGLRTQGTLDELLRDYLVFQIAGDNYLARFEGGWEYFRLVEEYWELITSQHGEPDLEDFQRVMFNMQASDFDLQLTNQLKHEYLTIAWPEYLFWILNSMSSIAEIDTSRLLRRIYNDIKMLQEHKEFTPILEANSKTDKPKVIQTIDTGHIVADMCFTAEDNLVVVCYDYPNRQFVVNLFDREGNEKARYDIQGVRPRAPGAIHDIEVNRYQGDIALVIDGKLFPFDSELSLLEPEDPFALMRADCLVSPQELKELLHRNVLVSLATFDVGEKEVSFGVFCKYSHSDFKEVIIVTNEKQLTFPFNSRRRFPAKSPIPAVAPLPEGDVIVYSGDLFRTDLHFTKYSPFALPFTSNIESGRGDSQAATNSKFAIDLQGRLFIINQYGVYESTNLLLGEHSDLASSRDHKFNWNMRLTYKEPTPSLKVIGINGDELEHLTAIPLTGVGNMDYYSSVAIARDQRFALSKIKKIVVYAPIRMPSSQGKLASGSASLLG